MTSADLFMQGESGGALLCNGELTGVLSNRMSGCYSSYLPNIYTDITYYNDFIDRALNDVDDRDEEITNEAFPSLRPPKFNNLLTMAATIIGHLFLPNKTNVYISV